MYSQRFGILSSKFVVECIQETVVFRMSSLRIPWIWWFLYHTCPWLSWGNWYTIFLTWWNTFSTYFQFGALEVNACIFPASPQSTAWSNPIRGLRKEKNCQQRFFFWSFEPLARVVTAIVCYLIVASAIKVNISLVWGECALLYKALCNN